MLHHERLRPPSRDYPADEWNVIEKAFHPEFLAQSETMLALGNGYLGMRGCPEEGGPCVENGTFINGFYETRPIVYGEDAYGFARTGQTICNVTDGKTIKLFVDDEPFWLPNAHLLNYDRRLNMKLGTLDREILWETPAGKQVLITSRRLVSFPDRHVAAISYCVTLLNAQAFVVISSEMAASGTGRRDDGGDPRLARTFEGPVLHPRASYCRDRRIVLCHGTEKSRFMLACATDNRLEGACSHSCKVMQTADFGQAVFTVEAQPGCQIRFTKYMVYHTSQTASAEELCGRAEWTLDRCRGFLRVHAARVWGNRVQGSRRPEPIHEWKRWKCGLDAVAGRLVELVERDLLALGGRGIERHGTGDKRQTQEAFPVGAGGHTQNSTKVGRPGFKTNEACLFRHALAGDSC